MTTARQLAAAGCHIFRAGVWKPRTKPGGFEGNGEKALPWMQEVKRETGMLTATEVATPEHVELAIEQKGPPDEEATRRRAFLYYEQELARRARARS